MKGHRMFKVALVTANGYNFAVLFHWQCIIQALIHINGAFVLNNYVRFATIQRFSQPSVQSYPWRRARWMLMCAHRISSDTPFHLSSARCSPFISIALIKASKLDSSAVLSFLCCFSFFLHVCLCTPLLPLTLHLSLYLPQFFSSLCSCKLSFRYTEGLTFQSTLLL